MVSTDASLLIWDFLLWLWSHVACVIPCHHIHFFFCFLLFRGSTNGFYVSCMCSRFLSQADGSLNLNCKLHANTPKKIIDSDQLRYTLKNCSIVASFSSIRSISRRISVHVLPIVINVGCTFHRRWPGSCHGGGQSALG